MSRGLLLRTLASVAVAGQLQLLPLAIACAAQHARPAAAHCEEAPPADGPRISGTGCHAAPACQLGMGCAAAAAAVPSLGFTVALSGDQLVLPAGAVPALVSFDSSPAPPPPQA